ncbi:tyrosine recombinase XerC [Ignatzschineria sp. LJL83]
MIERSSPLVTEANLFLEHYALQYREHSVRVKKIALDQLIQYAMAEGITDWQKCDERFLRHYMISRVKKPMVGSRKLSTSSVETQLASIRIFFQYLQEKKILPCNYARLVLPPKKERRLPKMVEADLLNNILNQPVENDLEVRDLAILELLYSSGLRLAELASLELSDINFAEELVRIEDGKGGKDRIVPIGLKSIESLQKWLEVRQIWLSQGGSYDCNALFISKRGERLSDRQISRRVKSFAEKRGLNINLHPHLLRHSMATHVLESSQDIRLVQELLGHADISTTQVYTHLNFNHLAKVFDAAHPRAKRKKKIEDRLDSDEKD